MNVLKRIGIGLAAAVVAGIVFGGLSRALMRLATLAVGGVPGFSWEATFFIVLIHVIAAVPAAMLAAFTKRWWRWSAAVAGTALLAVPAAGIASADLGATGSLTAAQWVGAIAATVAIFASFVVLPLVAVRLVDRGVVKARLRSAIPATAV
jgi:hypothetical protein